MKILITGCGMLGYDLCRVFENEEIFCLDIVEPHFPLPTFHFQLCDITDFEKTYKTITKINPEIVIHTAAWTDVDGAEKNQTECFRVNVLGTRNVAIACQRFDAAMVYISTDYVFDGENTPDAGYSEVDNTNPVNIYGRTKLIGEKYVEHLLNKFFIIRSSWLYGINGKNFVKTIINLAKEKKELKVVDDQVGCPTYTKDLAEAIKKLLTIYDLQLTGLYGMYHITNSSSCSWYEFAKEILEITNYKLQIKPITTEELKRPAKRPKNSVLKNFIWELNGFKPLENWRQALKNYLGEI